MRVVKGRSRLLVPRTLLAIVLSCVACAYVAWMSLRIGRTSASGVSATAPCLAEHYPTLCAHRIVGDEVDLLSGQPLRGMAKLFSEGIYCFDADVVRYGINGPCRQTMLLHYLLLVHKFLGSKQVWVLCVMPGTVTYRVEPRCCIMASLRRLSDDSLYVAHPLMFKPVIEHKLQQPFQHEDGQSLTDAVLLEAQTLTHEDVVQAEPQLAHDDVRPVPLKSVLYTYAPMQPVRVSMVLPHCPIAYQQPLTGASCACFGVIRHTAEQNRMHMSALQP